MIIPSILGEIRLEGNLAGWQLTHTGTILEPDLEETFLHFYAEGKAAR